MKKEVKNRLEDFKALYKEVRKPNVHDSEFKSTHKMFYKA